jgi:catechol 2,3-dioxygenase-like lactoylglutathione lyase family enzyme
MPGPMLDHVQIAAPPGCEQAARHFFGGLLGLEELPKPAPLSSRGGCWFALGDRQPSHGERRFYSTDPWGNRIEFLAAAE